MRIVQSVLAGDDSIAEDARQEKATETSIGKWHTQDPSAYQTSGRPASYWEPTIRRDHYAVAVSSVPCGPR